MEETIESENYGIQEVSNQEKSRPIMRLTEHASALVLIVLAIIQFAGGVLSIVLFHFTVMKFFGYYSIVCSCVALFGIFKRHSGAIFIHTSFAIIYSVSLLIWAILVWNDFVEKCQNDFDLYKRQTPVLYGMKCGNASWFSFAIGMYLIYDAVVAIFSLRFYNVLTSGGAVTAYHVDKNDEGGAPLLSDSSAFAPAASAWMKVLAGCLCAGLLVGTLFICIPTVPYEWHVKGYEGCPNGDDFLPSPMENELKCCEFHDHATCCRRKATCDDKHDYSGVFKNLNKNTPCDDLLGLLSCAPCNPNSCTFTSIPNGISRMCVGFCDQLYTTCAEIPLANGTPVWQEYNSSVVFCESEFAPVAPLPSNKPTCSSNTGCFALSSHHTPQIYLILLIILFSLLFS